MCFNFFLELGPSDLFVFISGSNMKKDRVFEQKGLEVRLGIGHAGLQGPMAWPV